MRTFTAVYTLQQSPFSNLLCNGFAECTAGETFIIVRLPTITYRYFNGFVGTVKRSSRNIFHSDVMYKHAVRAMYFSNSCEDAHNNR